MTETQIWNSLTPLERVDIVAGRHPEWTYLHKLWRDIQARDAETWVRYQIMLGRFLPSN